MNKPSSNEIPSDILIVDDDLPGLRALSTLLTDHGYEVRSATDGPTALMMASADPPDLILLDVIMPEMDGFQVCQRLKSDPKTGDIPVIFVSALDEVVDKVRGFEVGGVDYITKPFQAEEVLARVKTHLTLHDLRKELERRNEELQQEIAERIQAEEEASYERDLMQALLDNTTDYVYFKDRDRRFVRASNAFCDLFKRSLDDIIGKADEELFPEEIAQETVSDDRRVIETGRPLINREEGGSISGEDRWVLTTKLPWYDKDGNIIGLFGISRDITERRQAANALKARTDELGERVKELSALNHIAQIIATAADLGETLGTTAEIVTYLFAARTALISIPEAEEAELRILAGFEPNSGAFGTTGQAFPLNKMPITRQVLEQGQSTVLPDVRQLALADPVNGFVNDLDLRAFMLVPLKVRGAVIGVLAVGSDQPERTFTSAEVALAETIASDVAAAIENARLAEQARAAAVDTERGRLARELHDSVTQALYSITLHADATLMALSAGKIDVVEERLKLLNERAREAMTEMRLLIHELRPSILEEAGLAAALRVRLESVEVRSGLKADLQVVGERRRLPAEVEDTLYRVALEALNNVLKHARASSVVLHLFFENNVVRLTVQDDGSGFDVDSAARYGGYGLAMMKERVQYIDGALSIETAPGAGTTLCVEVKA